MKQLTEVSKQKQVLAIPVEPVSKRVRVMKALKKDWQLYTFLILPIIYLVIFKYIPMFGNVIAFRRFMPGGSIFGEEWVGLHYFKMFIQDEAFWQVFTNTLVLSTLTLILVFPAPIIIALLLNEIKSTKFKKFIQTTSYLPHFLSMVIISGMILQLTASNGALNSLIQFFGGEPILFMQDPKWYRPIYIVSEVWQTMGWGAILYLAALTNIDDSLYEAAKIDGANRWKQTIHITIPGILPTIIVLLILNIGNLLSVGFEKILLTYNPLNYETSDVISTYLYRVGLQSSNFSYATAIGLFEAIIGLILVFSANYFSKKYTQNGLW